jgi:hypothetical protein
MISAGFRYQQGSEPQGALIIIIFFFLLALQPPFGVVFYSPLEGFSLLAYEVT